MQDNEQGQPALPKRFWSAAIATALLAVGANMGWVEAGGFEISGQSVLVSESTSVDPSLVYLVAAISAAALFWFVTSRNSAAFFVCAVCAVGAAGVLGVNLAELLDDTGFSPGTGAYLTGGSAAVLLLSALAGAGAASSTGPTVQRVSERAVASETRPRAESSVEEQPSPAQGWYDDPEQVGFLRYWDGSSWTEDRTEKQG